MLPARASRQGRPFADVRAMIEATIYPHRHEIP